MGEELKFEKLYIKTDDGELVLFEGITQIEPPDIWVGDDMDEETYASLIQGGEVTLKIIRTHKQARQTARAMNAITNCYRRRLRTLYRRKEKERRRRLKYGV